MFAEVLEDSQIVVQKGHCHDVAGDVLVEGADVFLLLFVERLARLRNQVTVMEEFDGLFKADGDEQADDDGDDVGKAVSPGGGGVVRGWTSSMASLQTGSGVYGKCSLLHEA